METIEINSCQGYLWRSDKDAPEVFTDEKVKREFDDTENPFVVEGQLYDTENSMSYSIRYVDGQYLVGRYKVEAADLANKENEICRYLSNRMDNRWLRFLQYWEVKVNDDKEEKNNGGGKAMPVLELTKTVFIGFEE